VKLSGHIELDAIDPARKPDDRSLGHWEYSASEARKLWHAGFLSSGFQISENWNRQPTGSKVVLVAKLTTLDGRQFEATHTLSVKAQGNSSPGVSKIPPVPDIPSETRRVPDPEPWELDQQIPKSPRPKSESLMKQGLPPVISTQPLFGEAPETKANGLQTSDRWTDADTPTFR
ncbi:MAG TPA: hypothetical protein VNQ76_06965, partial [Planctomicrobium sp.]|nr:hypothetical protein [Planctomicrobium sp.]